MADMTPLIQTLIGGGLSLLGGFLSPLLIDSFRNKREATNLALAFAGEMTAVLRVVETRRYTEDIKTCIAQMEKTHEPIYYSVTIRQDYLRVYKQNVRRIGLLKAPLPENIGGIGPLPDIQLARIAASISSSTKLRHATGLV